MAMYRLYLRNDIYAKLVEKAMKEGKTVGRFINDILEKVANERLSCKKITKNR